MIAVVLKKAWLARSKKLIGMTAFNAFAIGRKWRMARFSSAIVASAKCFGSCSMQKYGVSNSSCRRMTLAPWSAALRARRSARAMLASTSQSHAICVAATVTRPGSLLMLMGSVLVGSGVGRNGAYRHLLVALPLPLGPPHVNGGDDHADRDDRDDDGGQRVDLGVEAEAHLGEHDLRQGGR